MPRFVRATSLVLLVAAVAGCGGGSAHPRIPPRLARGLAVAWAGRADAVASAAAAGDDCQALRLAQSLRQDVVARSSSVPASLRRPLLTSVSSLVARIVCTPPPPVTHGKKPPKKKPPKKPHPKPPGHDHGHGPPGHDHGHGGGDG